MQWRKRWIPTMWMVFVVCWPACCSTKTPAVTAPTVDLGAVEVQPGPQPGTLLVSRAALMRLGDALLASRAALERCRAGLR